MAGVEKWFGRVGLACIGVGLALGLTEIVLRAAGLRYATVPLDPDPMLHHKHTPGIRFVAYLGGADFPPNPVWIDARGCVTAPDAPLAYGWNPDAAVRIAFMGDSFTEAVQVPFADSFVGRLAAAAPANACLLNFGVASYSPVLYLLQWRSLIRPLDPTHVVVQLHGNDVRDDAEYAEGAVSLDADGLPIAVPGPPRNPWTALWRKMYVGHLFRRFQRQAEFHARGRRHTRMVETEGIVEEHPALEPLTLKALDRLAAEVHEAGATLVVFATPSRRAGTVSTFHAHVLAWAAERGVTTVSMREESLPWDRLHFKRDIHWNAAGHAAVASLLAPVLPGWPVPAPLDDAIAMAAAGPRAAGSAPMGAQIEDE